MLIPKHMKAKQMGRDIFVDQIKTIKSKKEEEEEEREAKQIASLEG